MPESLLTSEAQIPDKLIAGSFPRVSKSITLITGQNLVRGAVLGKITASGKYTLSLSASVDGSETPALILTKAADATAADLVTLGYQSGEFNEDALTIGTGHTADSIRDGLRDLSIYLKTIG